MSKENVEFVKALFAGQELEKEALLSALPELIAQGCDPEIEWHEDPQRADAHVYRGHDGVRESFERWLDQWDEYGTEAERFVDCGDDVLVVAREHGRGAMKRRNGERPDLHRAHVPQQQAPALPGVLRRGAALEAVGLSELDAHADS